MLQNALKSIDEVSQVKNTKAGLIRDNSCKDNAYAHSDSLLYATAVSYRRQLQYNYTKFQVFQPVIIEED